MRGHWHSRRWFWLDRFSRTCCMPNIVEDARLWFPPNQPHQATHNRDQQANQLPLTEFRTLAIKHISVVSPKRLKGDVLLWVACAKSRAFAWRSLDYPSAKKGIVLHSRSSRENWEFWSTHFQSPLYLSTHHWQPNQKTQPAHRSHQTTVAPPTVISKKILKSNPPKYMSPFFKKKTTTTFAPNR